MTDVQDVQAGRELDQLIAERIGWTEISDQMIVGRQDLHGTPPGAMFPTFMVPRFSTSVDAAWSLLEGRNSYGIATNTRELSYSMKLWAECDGYDGWAERDQPALAICRAWLAWKESKG